MYAAYLMRRCSRYLLLLLVVLISSCGTQEMGLQVKQYHLRERMFEEDSDPMARGEVRRFLHGCVTVEEKLQKVGQYYHVIFRQDETQAVETIFEYRQAATGSKVIRSSRKSPASKEIHEYFAINGDSYRKKGRVLAWRVRIISHGKTIASEHSYMWR